MPIEEITNVNKNVVRVETVDSFQGKEAEIVILLTTKAARTARVSFCDFFVSWFLYIIKRN